VTPPVTNVLPLVTSVTLPVTPPPFYVRCAGGLKPRVQQGKPEFANQTSETRVRRVPVKRKCWLVVLVSLAAAGSVRPSSAAPVDATQIAAWLTGGISSARLARIVQSNGVAQTFTPEQLRQIEAAGAEKNLIQELTAQAKSDTSSAAGSIPDALLKATDAARQQRWHEAELLLRKTVLDDPQNAAFHYALSAMLRQQEQWDDAFDEMTASARLMPDLPENHSSFAYIFYRLDDGPNAIAEARTALSMDPQNSEAYQYLGLALYSNGQYRAAIHAYAESLVRDPANADTYYDMGIALHADGNVYAAKAAYNHAIQLRPAFWEAHSNLALTLHEEGKLTEALAEYREALRIAPHEPSVRNNLANTYCDLGDYDSASTELHELYREQPEWQQGHSCMASAYMAQKNYSAAVSELQLAVVQNPTGSAEHRRLGQALLLDNKSAEALREFRLAVSLNPDSDVAHHFLGTALFQQGQVHTAEKEFREALRLNASADNHYALAACLMTMDRYEEALSELDLAYRLAPDHQLYRARREELIKLMKETNSR
jgi:tetratricopeptide (TPR) repeat protein